MKHNILIVLTCLIFSSCVTYVIPKPLLISQFESIDSTHLVMKKVLGPGFLHYEYLANPITDIQCEDKNGQSQTLINSPSIEIRITEKTGEKTIFYFDRILVTNSHLLGVRSRLAPFINKQIDMANIKSIEVQDGRKNFKYKN